MNLAKVIGRVVATQKYPTLKGAKLLIIQPLNFSREPVGNPITAVDTVGMGEGEEVYYITAREATLPLPNVMAPVDASIVGKVDRIDKGI